MHIGVPFRGVQIERYTCTLKLSTLLQLLISQLHNHLILEIYNMSGVGCSELHDEYMTYNVRPNISMRY